MAFQFENLTPRIRFLMAKAMEGDLCAGTFPFGKLLTPAGREAFPLLLHAAALSGTEDALALALARPEWFLALESVTRAGVTRYRRVNVAHAARRLAESEFNRYYARAVCTCAEETGRGLEVYRARASAVPRPESEALVGTRCAPVDDAWPELRSRVAALPPGSGLSVRLLASSPAAPQASAPPSAQASA